MSDVLILLACFGFAIAAALIPILIAEAYLLVNIAVVDESLVWPLLAVMTLGTLIGKLLLFWGARSSRKLLDARVAQAESRAVEYAAEDPDARPIVTKLRRWSQSLLRFLGEPVKGPVTVFVSAVVGIPPLAVVAFLAGASQQRATWFALAVFAGRGIRFIVFALPVIAFV